MATPQNPTNPAEIARETLKVLMARRMSPSPDNYRAIYHEIAGIAEQEEARFPDRELKSLLAGLPRDSLAQQRLVRQLEQATRDADWESCRRNLVDFVKGSGQGELAWGELIAELLRQWEAKQGSLTPARKREALERVLAGGSRSGEVLFGRLQGLVRSWAQSEAGGDEAPLVDEPAGEDFATRSGITPVVAPPALASRASDVLADLRELFAYTIEVAVVTQLADHPELAAEARSVATGVRGATTLPAVTELQAAVKRLAYRLEFVAEDRDELRGGILKLLQLLLDNVSELVVDDKWLNGQVAVVREIVARPMNIRSISDAEHRLKEVIFKQSQLKHSLGEAKEALKHLLAGFVDHLAAFADTTSGYHDRMERCVEKIGKADNITQLEDVMAEVIRETRTVQLSAQRSRDELRATRQRVDDAEKRVATLQSELDKASSLVRHDQLTGVLNRRGLDETYEQEVARARRRRAPLCIALLDIDNFKRLNDSFGHDAGDAALIHLVTVAREALRPQDTLARYGGEEFIILLPDTGIEDAQKVLIRVQRELTKRIFLADNEKILITFSAGVTDLRPEDNQGAAIKRADEAMYTAKKTGKNRVVVG